MMARLVTLVAAGSLVATGHVPGATTFRSCAGAGAYWPTMTLALEGRHAWVACKEQFRLVRIDTVGNRIDATVKLNGSPIAVATGLGAVWALDSGGTLYRIEQARITKRSSVSASAPYNLWIGAGSVWIADDGAASVLRMSPKGRTLARIPVGDGPADIAFAGRDAYVIDHRDRKLFRVDLATNRARLVLVVPGDAPERMVFAGGALWVTGRGTDLVRIDAASGAVVRTVEIGASGIDVVAHAGALWVPTRSEAVDRSGFPTMAAMKRVSIATGAVSTASTAVGRVDVHGLVASDSAVWFADNTAGVLYRMR